MKQNMHQNMAICDYNQSRTRKPHYFFSHATRHSCLLEQNTIRGSLPIDRKTKDNMVEQHYRVDRKRIESHGKQNCLKKNDPRYVQPSEQDE